MMLSALTLKVLLFISSGTLSALLILLLRPLFWRYTVARPNARSSHNEPTPAGGGLAVIAAVTLLLAAASNLSSASIPQSFQLAMVLICVVALATVGAADDIWQIQVLPRLLLQALCVAAMVVILPSELHVLPHVPWWLERILFVVALLWFVNLVNFMDGIDWMTVSEVVPVTAALAGFGAVGYLPHEAALAAVALCGAMLGFAPFNKPVAKLFLGDVGSLSIGLLLGWLLLLLAGAGHLIAALLLPLYYLSDATITLMSRLVSGENATQAHRCHFYQQALDGGLSVYQITGRVFGLNILLVGLAVVTLNYPVLWIQLTSLAAGVSLVAILMLNFKSWNR